METRGRGGNWLGMHSELANVYMCTLTEHVASQNQLHPVTDQALPHAAVNGWTVERLAEVLLDQRLTRAPELGPRDPLDTFVSMAFETVVPADLTSVPIDKIVEVRSKFGADLDRFREYVTSQIEQM